MLNTQTRTKFTPASSIDFYLHELRRYPLMSREEEHDVAVQLRTTEDQRLAAQLVTANLRLVVKIAREYRGAHGSLPDLVQEGNVGLVEAATKYDPSRGVKFSSYASWWIRAHLLKFVISNHRLVKLGTTQAQRKLFFNVRKVREKLERQGFEVQAKQLAAALDVSEQEVIDMERRLDATEASLDLPAHGEREGMRRDVVAAPASRPDVDVERREFNAVLVGKIRAFGETLRGREADIFHERLLKDEPLRLAVLAGRFGVSRERVRQLEDRLKERLRDYLEDEIGDIEADDVSDRYAA
jgi:RNA polymerase sigma-32 factor